MERTGTLIREKYRENFAATLAMAGSASIASIVDRIMVGNLLSGTDLAALNLTSPVVCVINVIFCFFIYGGNTLAVTLKGGRDQQGADKAFSVSIFGGAAGMLLFALLGILFQTPIARALAAGNEDLIPPVREYLFPMFFTGLLILLVNGMSAYIRSDGLKTLAVVIPVIANLVNLVMDYVFMGILRFGIGSAGWATNIGYTAGLFLLIPYLRSKRRSVFFTKPDAGDLPMLRDILKTGLASALVYVSLFLRSLVLNWIVVSLGGVTGSQVAAVCLSANSVALIFYGGSTQTVLPIGGALYGEKDYKGLRETMKTALITTEVFCVLVMAVFLLFPRQFGVLFGVDSPEAAELLDSAFRIFALSLPFTGLQELFRVCLQCTGRRNAASAMTAAAGTVCFIPVIWLLSFLGSGWIWLSCTAAPVLAVAGTWLALSRKAKKKGTPGSVLLPEVDEKALMFDFSISSSISQAEEASKQVIALCEQNGVPEVPGNNLGVAAEELCTNIAKYAYGKRTDSVDLFLRISAEDVVLRVRDNGMIFNPVEFKDDSGRKVTGLGVLRALPLKTEYNRVLGFNNTIVTVGRT